MVGSATWLGDEIASNPEPQIKTPQIKTPPNNWPVPVIGRQNKSPPTIYHIKICTDLKKVWRKKVIGKKVKGYDKKKVIMKM